MVHHQLLRQGQQHRHPHLHLRPRRPRPLHRRPQQLHLHQRWLHPHRRLKLNSGHLVVHLQVQHLRLHLHLPHRTDPPMLLHPNTPRVLIAPTDPPPGGRLMHLHLQLMPEVHPVVHLVVLPVVTTLHLHPTQAPITTKVPVLIHLLINLILIQVTTSILRDIQDRLVHPMPKDRHLLKDIRLKVVIIKIIHPVETIPHPRSIIKDIRPTDNMDLHPLKWVSQVTDHTDLPHQVHLILAHLHLIQVHLHPIPEHLRRSINILVMIKHKMHIERNTE